MLCYWTKLVKRWNACFASGIQFCVLCPYSGSSVRRSVLVLQPAPPSGGLRLPHSSFTVLSFLSPSLSLSLGNANAYSMSFLYFRKRLPSADTLRWRLAESGKRGVNGNKNVWALSCAILSGVYSKSIILRSVQSQQYGGWSYLALVSNCLT